MKKVIEQKDESRIEVEFYEHRIQLTLMSPFDDFGGEIVIGKSTAREVALVICPELETELNHKEFEMNRFCKLYQEAVNLTHFLNRELEQAANLLHNLTFDDPNICDLAKKEVSEFISKYRK